MKKGDYSLENEDLFLTANILIKEKGLVSHHIESYNETITKGIKEILQEVFNINKWIENKRQDTEEDKLIDKIYVQIKFFDTIIENPTFYKEKKIEPEYLLPLQALRENKTYSSNVYVSFKIIAQAFNINGDKIKERVETKNRYRLCRMPIMVGSCKCNLNNFSRNTLNHIKEEEYNHGGYFIIDGVEWVIESSENILFNAPRIFKNVGYKKELVRVEIISREGNGFLNSSQVIIRYSSNHKITIEILRDKFRNVEIPFFIIYRLLGWNNDKKIFDSIIYGSQATNEILEILKLAMIADYDTYNNSKLIYDCDALMNWFLEQFKTTMWKYLNFNNENEKIQAINYIYNQVLDTWFLPHLGSNISCREKKLYFLSYMMRNMLLTHLGYLKPTDRDSYLTKRIFPAGIIYPSTFKTFFNISIVMPIFRKIVKQFVINPFSNVKLVDIVTSLIYGSEFEKAIIQAIKSGKNLPIKMSHNKTTPNRIISQQLERKNQLAMLATLRQITSSSTEGAKQSERENEIRRIHPSSIGYICNISSSVGEKVGLNKQMTLFTKISVSSSNQILKNYILNDKELLSYNEFNLQKKTMLKLAEIFVNGYPLGYVKDPIAFSYKYKKFRREGELNSYDITIHWKEDLDEVHFWCDHGRISRLLFIVYNNIRDYHKFGLSAPADPKDYHQCILLNKTHIQNILLNKLTLNDLIKENIIEFITPEEQSNCLVASSFEKLKKQSGDYQYEYTHCDIPQAQLGLTGLTSPYGENNDITRLVYQSNMCKQTCGAPPYNWPYRFDKNTFMQYVTETPLIITAVNNYINPIGLNTTVAIMCNSGYNQEDSVIISDGFIKRGAYNGCKFYFYDSELFQNEEFKKTSIEETGGVAGKSFNKLDGNIVRPGTFIKKNDVLIAKVNKDINLDTIFKYKDKSVVYDKDSENVIVHNILEKGKNDDNKDIMKVLLRKFMPVLVGDKFSSRLGQKGVCARLVPDNEMPFTSNGVIPGLIINPHSIPTRMTLGQIDESFTSILCAKKGCHMDGTIFKKKNMNDLIHEMGKLGFEKHGYQKLYNGVTGEEIDSLIFMGPVYYQRLQKFVSDIKYSINKSPINKLTRQPLEGRSSGGGLKIGEMERDVLSGHGTTKAIFNKFYTHSDGYTEYVCRCGLPVVVNEKKNIYKCYECGDNADISKIETSWSSKLFFQFLNTMNVGVRRKLKPFIFEKM